MSTYEVPDDQMAVGSTLGAPRGAIILKANGAIERFYSIDAGEIVVRGMQVYYWDPVTKVPLGKLPGQFVIHPDRQEHVYELSNGLTIRERVFMLNGQPELKRADPAIAYYHVEVENTSGRALQFASIAACDLRGMMSDDVRVRYDAKRNAFIAVNDSAKQFARAFSCSLQPQHWEVTSDHGKCSRVDYPGPLSETIVRGGDQFFALFEHVHTLDDGEKVATTFMLSVASQGTPELRRIIDRAPSVRVAAERTRERYHTILNRAVVMTPDADVNRGVLWA
jgi:hypothetical protein